MGYVSMYLASLPHYDRAVLITEYQPEVTRISVWPISSPKKCQDHKILSTRYDESSS